LYVADSVFVGTEGSWHRHHNKKEPYKAVWVAGQGIDVCYNRVANHWDGLSAWKPEPTERFQDKLSSVDFYGNDVSQIVDDNEADDAMHNIRFFCNRFVDVYVGLSAQPVFGGPCWFVRNVQYNVCRGVAFKLNCNPAGVLIYHNTTVSSTDRAGRHIAGLNRGWWNTRVHNNLFLGTAGPTLVGGPIDPGVSRIDYNGYMAGEPVQWFTFKRLPGAPPAHERLLRFDTLAQFSDATGYEQHHVQVGFDDLVSVPAPDGQTGSDTPQDFGDARLKVNSPAVDAGLVIPNINDDFTGKAPDLGAYESGRPIPHYGPR
jgi:hypothetical protein